MRKLVFLLSIFLFLFSIAMAKDTLLIDDFEGPITKETVDFGAGRDSSVEVLAEKIIRYSGKQSMKVLYNAILGGYIWIARGYDLDVKGTGPWNILPQNIDWEDFNAVSFYMYGQNSKNKIAFDIKDNGNEMWRFMVEDAFLGWKQIVCPFQEFFARADWQPQNSDRDSVLNFPIKSFQFEPLPEGKGTLYFDCVELIKE